MKGLFDYKKESGFTLIELLVVIAIIGILSSVVLASLNSARTKARDASRVTALRQLQLAVELYFDAKSSYPTDLSQLVGSTNGASLPRLPTDPSSPSENYSYSFDPGVNPTKYHLGASLEQASGATTLGQGDADANSTLWGGGTKFNGADSAKCGTSIGGLMCYDLSNSN
ncbi:MAG: type II secretion system protein [Patescibacteria group bacterium]